MARGVAGQLQILCVIALLGAQPVLAAGSPERDTLAHVSALRAAIETHQKATGALPANTRQLGTVARLYAPGLPLQSEVPLDGWQRPVVYRPPAAEGGAFTLYSMGENGVDDGGEGDDIGGPEAETAHRQQLGVERALQLLPLAAVLVLGPLAFAAIRAARRGIR